MAATGFDEYYDKVTDYCLAAHDRRADDDALALATGAMQMPGFPMHYPVHHYLVPAVLLTVARGRQGHPREVLERDLAEALTRARQVPGGACGFQGACGAAVGVGIFWSVLTDTAPVSADTWGDANRATANALLAMAEVGGPRCCKRCTWLALASVAGAAEEKLGLHLAAPAPECGFYETNAECLKARCPYYPQEGRREGAEA